MIVLRSKLYSVPQDQNQNPQNQFQPNNEQQVAREVSSRDLQVEQMKQQRQLLQTQRMRQKLEMQERLEKARQIQRAQRDKLEEKENIKKELTQAKKQEQLNGAQNVSLYKTRAHAVDPVPMKN